MSNINELTPEAITFVSIALDMSVADTIISIAMTLYRFTSDLLNANIDLIDKLVKETNWK